MSLLHVIKADNTYTTQKWTGELEYGAPPFREMYKMVGTQILEHVSVLWKGRRAHMFVDENGLLRDPQPPRNWRASFIYANATLQRGGARSAALLYNDLSEEPDSEWGRVRMGVLDDFVIVGTALLWEGDLE